MVRARLRVPEEGLGCGGIDVKEHIGVSAGIPGIEGILHHLGSPMGYIG